MSDAIENQHEPITTLSDVPQFFGGTSPGVSGVVSHGCYTAQVVAHQRGGGPDRAAWNVFFMYYVDADGNMFVGSNGLQIVSYTSDGDVSPSWMIEAAIQGTMFGILVTGSPDIVIEWGINYQSYWVYEDL